MAQVHAIRRKAMDMESLPVKVRIIVEATIIRADGTLEPLGVIATSEVGESNG